MSSSYLVAIKPRGLFGFLSTFHFHERFHRSWDDRGKPFKAFWAVPNNQVVFLLYKESDLKLTLDISSFLFLSSGVSVQLDRSDMSGASRARNFLGPSPKSALLLSGSSSIHSSLFLGRDSLSSCNHEQNPPQNSSVSRTRACHCLPVASELE